MDDYQEKFEQYRDALLNDERFTGTLSAARRNTHSFLVQSIQKNGLLLGSALLCALGGILFGVFSASFYDLSPENTVYQIIRLVLIAGFSVSFYFSYKLHKKHFSKTAIGCTVPDKLHFSATFHAPLKVTDACETILFWRILRNNLSKHF